MPTWTLTSGLTGPATPISKSVTQTATGTIEIVDEAVSNGSTDVLINMDLDVSACKLFYLHSNAAVTVETNDATSAADTISLDGTTPYTWHADAEDSFAITEDVSALYITNSSGSAATINVRAMYDATP